MSAIIFFHWRITHFYRVASIVFGVSLALMVVHVLVTTSGFASELEYPPAKYMVTKLADTNDGSCDVDCSLREALAAATPDDIVEFESGLTGTITLGSTLTISKNVTINGPSTKAIIISGNNSVRVFYINSAIRFTINNLTVANGRIEGAHGSNGGPCEWGGAGDMAMGGGLYNKGGIVSVNNSTFSNNKAVGGAGGSGGGYHPDISRSTICSRSASGGSGGDGMGGAVFSSGTVSLVNSTFSGNRAIGGRGGHGGYMSNGRGMTPYAGAGGNGGNGLGGALYIVNDAHVSSCTFANNGASGATYGLGSPHGALGIASGVAIFRSGSFATNNTVIADNSSGGNCNGSIASEGYNIDSDGTCGLKAIGDLTKFSPKLGPLRNNGGATFTHALLPGSPAINAGNPAGCADPNGATIIADQRGHIRNGRCDIGAFEFSP